MGIIGGASERGLRGGVEGASVAGSAKRLGRYDGGFMLFCNVSEFDTTGAVEGALVAGLVVRLGRGIRELVLFRHVSVFRTAAVGVIVILAEDVAEGEVVGGRICGLGLLCLEWVEVGSFVVFVGGVLVVLLFNR
jgi:hypothetical protein